MEPIIYCFCKFCQRFICTPSGYNVINHVEKLLLLLDDFIILLSNILLKIANLQL